MLFVLSIGLFLIPAFAILWPFVVGGYQDEFDESSPVSDLMRRWDAAVAGLKSTELDHAIGNLSDTDYRLLRFDLMNEAGIVLKTMELGNDEETELFEAIHIELRKVREQIDGQSKAH